MTTAITLKPSNFTYNVIQTLKRGTVTFGMNPNNEMLGMMFLHTYNTNITEENHTFELVFKDFKVEDGEVHNVPVIPDLGELPDAAIKLNRRYGLPDDCWPLLPNKDQFGVAGLGFALKFHFDVTDEELATLVGQEMQQRLSASNINGKFFGVPGKEIEQTAQTPDQNSDVDYVTDARYFIAAREAYNAGRKVLFWDKQREDVRRLDYDDLADLDNDEQPRFALNGSKLSGRFLPLVDTDLMQQAEEYYVNGVPLLYSGLTRCIPVSQINAKLLANEKMHSVVMSIADDAGNIKLGTRIAGRFTNYPDDSTSFKADDFRLTGDEAPLEADDTVYGTMNTTLFVIVDDASIEYLQSFGYEPVNYLDWSTGLHADDEEMVA